MPQPSTGHVQLSNDIVYSPKVYGLCLYMARLLRPVWRWSIITFATSQANPNGRKSFAATGLYPHRRFDANELRAVARPLAELRCVCAWVWRRVVRWHGRAGSTDVVRRLVVTSNVMEMMKPELARSDEDEFIGREQPSAQQFQALKDGAAGFNGVGRDRGNMPHNSVDHKAVRVEADYERGLYRCVRCVES